MLAQADPGQPTDAPNALAEWYRGGWSLDAIAEMAGLSRSTVRARLIEAGVELRPTGRPRGARRQA